MKTQILLIALFFYSILSFSQKDFKTTVYFDTDKSSLTQEHLRILKSVYDSVKTYEKFSILLAGHTDFVGDSSYNMLLSNNRVNNIKDGLTELGVNSELICSIWKGENQPIADNNNYYGRSLNRRVEIIVSLPEENQIVEYTIDKKSEKKEISALDELYKLIAPDADTFNVFDNQDTILITSEGSVIYIEKNSFNVQDDSAVVQLIVKERTKNSDIIRENLTTVTTRNKIMVSQSMMLAEANYNGMPVDMTKDMKVLIPTNNIDSKLNYFQGVASSNGMIKWSGNGSPLGVVPSRTFDRIYGGSSGNCRFFFCGLLNLFRNPVFNIRSGGRQWSTTSFNDYSINETKLEDFEKKYSDLNIEAMKDIPKEELQYYVFNRKLGWSNLDWLYKVRNPIRYKINTKPDANTTISVVFKKQRSIVPMHKGRRYFYFNSLPRGEKVIIVGLRYVDGKPYLAIKETKISKQGFNNLIFEECTIAEMIEKLKILDS